MRVLVIASQGSPAIARFAPALATLAARGGRIEAGNGVARDLADESLPCTIHAGGAALDAIVIETDNLTVEEEVATALVALAARLAQPGRGGST